MRLAGPRRLGGDVLLTDFRDLCKSLAACLRRSEEIVSRGEAILRHRIVDLGLGSAVLALSPVARDDGPNLGSEVYRFLAETVDRLERGQTVDPRLTDEDLQAFRGLANTVAKEQGSVWIGGIELTTQYLATIDKIIGGAIPSEGTVTGRLERLNLHNRNEFALYAPVGGFSVTCSFPEEMLENVKAAIRKIVTVSGRLFFRPDSPFPERVQVRAIEVHPPDAELPTLASLRGLMPDATGGLSSVEFLRTVRDE